MLINKSVSSHEMSTGKSMLILSNTTVGIFEKAG